MEWTDMIDFVDPSKNSGVAYDLIVCGDALVYLGALEEAIDGISHQLVEGGVFCFTVEDLAGDNFALRPTGRYAHHNAYVSDLLIGSNHEVIKRSAIIPRRDSDQEVLGRLFLSQYRPPI